VKLSKSTTEVLEMLCDAFGEHSLSWTVDFQWHSHFKAGQVSVEDDKRSGWPSTSKMTENVENILELIHKGRRRTIHSLQAPLGSVRVCQEILTENLNIHPIAPSSQRAHPNVPKNHRLCD
jgi:hypothetical protein